MKQPALLVALAALAASAPALAAKPTLTPQSSQTHPLPPGAQIMAKPDLLADTSALLSSGTITVKNGGVGGAGASVATFACAKVSNGGGAALPAPQRCLLMKSQWANAVVFGTTGQIVKLHVPALAGGASFTYTLPFWSAAGWSHGVYELVLSADVDAAVAETNEGNNVASVSKTVP